jgi:hypothetical protein
MRQLKLLAWVLGSMLTLSAMAQETDYKSATYKINVPPTITNYKNYSTFDVSVTKPYGGDENFYNALKPSSSIILPNLKLVESGGDFHLVYYLLALGGKQIDYSNTEANVNIHLAVLDKYGEQVYQTSYVNEKLAVSYKALTKDESKSSELVNGLILAKALEMVNKGLIAALAGGEVERSLHLALLDGVKKKPELQEFEKQVKVLQPLFAKSTQEFVKAAEPFVSYWETMSNYSGEGNVNEVKRAAYNNLVVYYAATNQTEKAKAALALYKPIDKQVKEMFGLIKYMASDECERAISDFEKKEVVFTDAPLKADMPIISKKDADDIVTFITINGSFKVTSKNEEGSYVGTLKISRYPTPPQPGIDPLEALVKVSAKDAAGAEKTFIVGLSKIDDIKDNKGNVYFTQKFGSIGLGYGGSTVFLMTSYTSDKITVYRALLPATSSDYVIKKKGDDKGIKSTLFNARKTLIEYLSDCPSLVERLKNNAPDKKDTIEKIAADYTACN